MLHRERLVTLYQGKIGSIPICDKPYRSSIVIYRVGGQSTPLDVGMKSYRYNHFYNADRNQYGKVIRT